MAILRPKTAMQRGCKAFWKGKYLNFHFEGFLRSHRTFFASAGGPNARKTIIFIKKCPKIEFRAAKSRPMMVISSFLEALKDI